MIDVPSGGLTFFGGLLLATLACIVYAVKIKVPLRLGMDIVAPCLMIGLGFGRIGCFLNGCCYGAECSDHLPWAVRFPYHSNAYIDEFQRGELHAPPPPALLRPVPEDHEQRLATADELKTNPQLKAIAQTQHSNALHPAQLYSTITAWLIAGLLYAYFTVPHAPGRVFALMLLVESPSRFLLEMLRSEPPV